MASKDQTTVNLTEKAQVIKEDLAPVYGLKNILSAGLILLGRLTAEEQKEVINAAKNTTTGSAEWNPDNWFEQRVLKIVQDVQKQSLRKKHARKKKFSKSG